MNTPSSLFATMTIGFALGLRHALDTDHLVAVSTLVARERSFWRSTRVGAIWGLGHTATLFVMGLAIIVLGWRIPDRVEHWLELSVAVMLVLLGARTLYLWRHQGRPRSDNSHHTTQKRGAPHQSFWVGMVHGLSGSAELMLLVLATIHQPVWALIYITIFGAGMMVAMFVLTAVLARLLDLTARFKDGWKQVDNGLRALTGIGSLCFGTFLLWQLLYK